jgi:hypothetical protein
VTYLINGIGRIRDWLGQRVKSLTLSTNTYSKCSSVLNIKNKNVNVPEEIIEKLYFIIWGEGEFS